MEWLAHALADQEADQVTWFDLAGLIEHDPERGQAAWQTLKDEARQELATGFRAAAPWSPWSRGGRTSGRRSWSSSRRCARRSNRATRWRSYWCSMASAYELNLRWQALVVRRMETEVWQGERDRQRALENLRPSQRERYEQMEGWLPPRLSEAEALDQAVLMADRYQRAFLRLMKAFRDNRRLFGALVVAGGRSTSPSNRSTSPRGTAAILPRPLPTRRPPPARAGPCVSRGGVLRISLKTPRAGAPSCSGGGRAWCARLQSLQPA